MRVAICVPVGDVCRQSVERLVNVGEGERVWGWVCNIAKGVRVRVRAVGLD